MIVDYYEVNGETHPFSYKIVLDSNDRFVHYWIGRDCGIIYDFRDEPANWFRMFTRAPYRRGFFKYKPQPLDDTTINSLMEAAGYYPHIDYYILMELGRFIYDHPILKDNPNVSHEELQAAFMMGNPDLLPFVQDTRAVKRDSIIHLANLVKMKYSREYGGIVSIDVNMNGLSFEEFFTIFSTIHTNPVWFD